MTVTTPCADCGEPTIVAQDAAGRRIILDATVTVWGEEFDPEQRVTFYVKTGLPLFVEHGRVCRGR